ncbi:hypothetical protein PO909_028016 [Leuciscus waleckii]
MFIEHIFFAFKIALLFIRICKKNLKQMYTKGKANQYQRGSHRPDITKPEEFPFSEQGPGPSHTRSTH